jgi:hypothetical protein
VSGHLPSNQSPRANAWPKIAVSEPLMEFTHGESIAKNGEDGGAGGMGQERGRGFNTAQAADVQ